MRADGYAWFSPRQFLDLKRTQQKPYIYGIDKFNNILLVTQISNNQNPNPLYTDSFFYGPIVYYDSFETPANF